MRKMLIKVRSTAYLNPYLILDKILRETMCKVFSIRTKYKIHVIIQLGINYEQSKSIVFEIRDSKVIRITILNISHM